MLSGCATMVAKIIENTPSVRGRIGAISQGFAQGYIETPLRG
jgi:hypothetical protein